MSDENPFAVPRRSIGSDWVVDYGNETDYFSLDEWEAEVKAARINSAVAARERKAAAKALRDLAASIRCAPGVFKE